MKKINVNVNVGQPLSKADMKQIRGGEQGLWTCYYQCDNGSYGTSDGVCPDGNDDDYCFEGGQLESCVCVVN